MMRLHNPKPIRVTSAAAAAVLTLVLGSALVAYAQEPGGPPPGGGPGGGGPGGGGPGGPRRGPGGPGGPGGRMPFPMGGPPPEITAATMPPMVLERTLSLTDDQKEKIHEILRQLDEERRDMLPRPEPGSGPPDRDEVQAALTKVRAKEKESAGKVEAALTADQKKKLPGVLAEAKLLRGAGIPIDLTGDLKLTDDQRKKLAEVAPKERARPAANDGPPDFEAMRQEREELRAKVDAILTEDQKAQVRAAMQRLPRRGPGMGGPGGPGGRPGGGGPDGQGGPGGPGRRGPGGPGRGPGGPGGGPGGDPGNLPPPPPPQDGGW